MVFNGNTNQGHAPRHSSQPQHSLGLHLRPKGLATHNRLALCPLVSPVTSLFIMPRLFCFLLSHLSPHTCTFQWPPRKAGHVAGSPWVISSACAMWCGSKRACRCLMPPMWHSGGRIYGYLPPPAPRGMAVSRSLGIFLLPSVMCQQVGLCQPSPCGVVTEGPLYVFGLLVYCGSRQAAWSFLLSLPQLHTYFKNI